LICLETKSVKIGEISVDDFQQYKIDFENGTIPIGELSIGDRVVDPSWVWEFRTGVGYSGSGEIKPVAWSWERDGSIARSYSGSGEVKPVTWIIVAKDHYEGLETHVTLLSEELIGKYWFDNRSTTSSPGRILPGYNHWGDSGPGRAGLRPWLNSTGIHYLQTGEGFYQAFSENFKEAVLSTTLTNEEGGKGSAYNTQDRVFIPSNPELGSTLYDQHMGSAYPYFQRADTTCELHSGWFYRLKASLQSPVDTKRVAMIGGKRWWYWTRSPGFAAGYEYSVTRGGWFSSFHLVYDACGGVRPALNLKSGILVSEIKD
jgi:hypothetical protein